MFHSLKSLLAGTCLLAVIGFNPADSTAETALQFSGQVRLRAEVIKKSFAPGAITKDLSLLRTRLAAEASIDQHTRLFFQLQDSRTLGGADVNDNASSGTLNNLGNVDIHQAYILLEDLFGGHWGFQAGRFEVNLGGQRVFGAVGWHNVGRAWEGMDLWYQNDDFRTTVYWLKKAERDNAASNSDFDIFGANTIIKDTGLEAFGFFERDANQDIVVSVPSSVDALNRGSVGAYFMRAFGGADVESNLVYQFGDQAGVDTTHVFTQDISAYLLTGELGYTLSSESKIRLAAGVDYASGDSDPADDKYKAYNNLYYTGHKYRGYMDYFLSSGSEGLLDIIGRGSVDIAKGWKLKADFHFFKTAQDYTDFNNEQTRDVGAEIDLTVTTTRLAAVKIDGGLSMFMPSESYAMQADAKTGLWGYVMVTGNFKEK